jgi:uncharacterized protein with GYD domain
VPFVAKYLLLFSLTSEAIAGLVDHPMDRRGPASQLAESLGGTLESYYWMVGQHDGLVIFSLPDTASAAALSLAASSSGAYSHVETHELIATADLVPILAKAKAARSTFLPPGQSRS